MKVGTPGFVGERLREAREARGLTSASLASILGVTPAAMTQYENGDQTPRPEVMGAIASTLRIPPSFFLTPTKRELGVIFWRSLQSATKLARNIAARRLGWVQDITQTLASHLEFRPLNLPDLKLPRDPLAISDETIDILAMECRRYWGLGDGPIPNVAMLLEQNGVVLARDDLQETALDALLKWCPEERSAYCLVSSAKDSAVRGRFNLLHELGHLILHRSLDRWHLENLKLHGIIEAQAFRFAGAIALPTESFAGDVYSFSLDAFLTLKPKWKMSAGVMIKRCESLGILREETAQKLWRSVASRGWRTSEPLDDELPHEQPQMLKEAMEFVLNKGLIREELVGDWFNLPIKDLCDLTGLQARDTDRPGTVVSMVPANRPNRLKAEGRLIQLPKQSKILH